MTNQYRNGYLAGILSAVVWGGSLLTLCALCSEQKKTKSEPFSFENPVSANFKTLSREEQESILSKRQSMTDSHNYLSLGRLQFNLSTSRKVIDPSTGKSIEGTLDENGNICTTNGTYRLNSAHDSRWYEF
jgi:hypothetical protein